MIWRKEKKKSREEGENWMECWGRVHCFLEKLANFEGTSRVDIKGKRFPGKEISQKMRNLEKGPEWQVIGTVKQ